MLSHCSCVWLFANPLAVALQAPLSGGSPGKNDSVDSHSILQEIFPTQGLNSHLSCLLHIYIHMWKSLSRVRLFATSWTVAYQAPPSMGFSRQEYWSGLPFPSPGDLPDPGIEPGSPAFQADALTSEPEVTYLNFMSLSCVQLFVTPQTAAHQASLSITSSWSLLKLMSIELVLPSSHLILFPLS